MGTTSRTTQNSITPENSHGAELINQTLFTIANAVNTTLNLPQLYHKIHQALEVVFDVSNFYIAIFDIQNNTVNFPYYVDTMDKRFDQNIIPDKSSSLTGLIAEGHRARLFKSKELKALEKKGKIIGTTPKIWMGVPLRIKENVIGVIATQSYTDESCYDEKDLEILSAVSFQVAVAISRKQAEEKLFESEKRYRTLFEKSNDAILIIKNREFVDCNQATVDMLGYENKHQLLQTHPSKLSPPFQPDGKDSFVKANEMMDTAVKKGWHRFEWNHVRANGEVFPVEVLLTTITPEETNQEIHTIWRDITERKKAEAELRESKRKLTEILDTLPDPVVVYDLDGNTQYINPAFSNLFGFHFDEIQDRRIPYVPPGEQEITREVIKEIYRDKQPISYETKRLTKGNRILDMIVSAAVNRNESGEITGVVVNLKDITERKHLELQYKQAQKMEAIGTLAGGIAHDFNNILSGIFGFSQLAHRDSEKPEKVKSHINHITTGARRAAELVQQILTFSRQSEYQKQILDVHLVVKEALKLMRSTIPTNIDIKTDIHSKAKVLADPIKIHQVIINLCTNAYHAIKDSGTITVTLSEYHLDNIKKINNIDYQPGKYLKLEVSDTGQGMGSETLEKAFEPYFTTKELGKGTGFGLSIVHAIIEDHHGFIEVYSKVKVGTKFFIHLPVAEHQKRLRPEKKIKTHTISGHEHIMFVDDEEALRIVAKDVLERYGYTVSLFENGLEAIEEFKKNPNQYDLVVSDLAMPMVTGDALSVKLLKIRSDLPIILSTGYSESFSKEQAKELGIKQFLYKPIANRDLVAVVRSVLDDKSSAQ